MKTEKMVAPLLWVVGLIIGGLAIAAIASSWDGSLQHYLIVILVLIIFAVMVSIVNYVLSTGSADNYEVNDAEKGKENNAFDDETKKTESGPSGTQQSSQ